MEPLNVISIGIFYFHTFYNSNLGLCYKKGREEFCYIVQFILNTASVVYWTFIRL